MFQSVTKLTMIHPEPVGKRIEVYKCVTMDDLVLDVPDDMDNPNRQEIDEFVEDGGTITEEEI